MKYLTLVEAVGGDVIAQCQPFVFTPRNDEQGEVPPMPDGEILAAPFPVFSYEVEGAYLTSARSHEPNYCIASVLVEELTPDNYKFTVLIFNGDSAEYTWLEITDSVDTYNSIYNLTGVYLRRLHTEKRGVFKAAGRAKYRDDSGKKCIYKPRDVIYVSGKVASSVTGEGNNVQHLNSWSVMGHWRKIGGMGINRLGERTVDGFTWIKSYSKGDTVGNPVVRKVNK